MITPPSYDYNNIKNNEHNKRENNNDDDVCELFGYVTLQ